MLRLLPAYSCIMNQDEFERIIELMRRAFRKWPELNDTESELLKRKLISLQPKDFVELLPSLLTSVAEHLFHHRKTGFLDDFVVYALDGNQDDDADPAMRESRIKHREHLYSMVNAQQAQCIADWLQMMKGTELDEISGASIESAHRFWSKRGRG